MISNPTSPQVHPESLSEVLSAIGRKLKSWDEFRRVAPEGRVSQLRPVASECFVCVCVRVMIHWSIYAWS